jgi:hypothetical protein
VIEVKGTEWVVENIPQLGENHPLRECNRHFIVEIIAVDMPKDITFATLFKPYDGSSDPL